MSVESDSSNKVRSSPASTKPKRLGLQKSCRGLVKVAFGFFLRLVHYNTYHHRYISP